MAITYGAQFRFPNGRYEMQGKQEELRCNGRRVDGRRGAHRKHGPFLRQPEINKVRQSEATGERQEHMRSAPRLGAD